MVDLCSDIPPASFGHHTLDSAVGSCNQFSGVLSRLACLSISKISQPPIAAMAQQGNIVIDRGEQLLGSQHLDTPLTKPL